jgi:hypothetical protein
MLMFLKESYHNKKLTDQYELLLYLERLFYTGALIVSDSSTGSGTGQITRWSQPSNKKLVKKALQGWPLSCELFTVRKPNIKKQIVCSFGKRIIV